MTMRTPTPSRSPAPTRVPTPNRSWSATPLVRGTLEAVLLVAAFVGFGLGWAWVEGGPAPYAPAVEPATDEEPRIWLVDGYNVLCAGVLGVRDRTRWWSASNRRQLVELAERFEERDVELWVVFDGDHSPDEPPRGRVRVVFAAPADDWLLEQVKARARAREGSHGPGVALVTADRPLADRARHRGARVVEPREFVRRCMG